MKDIDKFKHIKIGDLEPVALLEKRPIKYAVPELNKIARQLGVDPSDTKDLYRLAIKIFAD